MEDVPGRLGGVESAVAKMGVRLVAFESAVARMDARLMTLESSLAEIKVQLASIASVLTSVLPHLATKADVNELRSEFYAREAVQLKWLVGTLIASVALACTIAKLVV